MVQNSSLKDIKSEMNILEQQKLSTINVAISLMHLMRNHIGRDKAVTRNDMFGHVFGKELDSKSIEDWLRWKYIRDAMHYLRQKSTCFIVSESDSNRGSIYYVVKYESEAVSFSNRVQGIIIELDKTQKRAFDAVLGKWYKSEWKVEDSAKRLKLAYEESVKGDSK